MDSDELAETATAPASPAGAARVRAPRATLGRYRLDAVLGEGGMGVVHAAFDGELERKVALKVLREAGSADARARLLREARALAKLSHPHVITVFDVGSADGEDFVAMELVDGETLGEWVRAHRERLRPRQILAAYIAAGRGLAAAHAAGLVHRDFKPSNVLRRKDGKILVTDFGLARETGAADGVAGTAALAEGVTATRTQTGAILGTPAYMAPEQWLGGEVTPATDQFAFCVAVWEALAGERPYRGDSVDELRTGVLAGPVELVADAVPRPLRPILRRGLARDPAERWPSMDALLAALERYARRPQRWAAWAAALAGVAAIAVVYVVARRDSSVADTCPAPAVDPAHVNVAALAARDAEAGQLVRDDLARWHTLRAAACAQPIHYQARAPKLACLEAVLARTDAVVRAALADTRPIDADGLTIALVDPALCERSPPPRLTPVVPELVEAFALRRHARAGSVPPAQLALATRASSPCARMVALFGRIERFTEKEVPANTASVLRDLDTIGELAPRCDDDAITTEAGLWRLHLKLSAGGIATADSILAAFPQDDLRGTVEAMRGQQAENAERWSDAAAAFARAVELAGKRHRTRDQLDAAHDQARILIASGRREDVAAAQALYARWVPVARRLGVRDTRLEEDANELRWALGDVAGADAATEAMRAQGRFPEFTPPYPQGPAVDVSGVVVDEGGAPVANADVAAAFFLIGDAHTIASPVHTVLQVTARTAADGTFQLARAHGWVMAQLADRRSDRVPVDKYVRLVLHPTGTVAGSVALGTRPAHGASVIARSEGKGQVVLVAPVRADSTFELAGVPRGKLALGVSTSASYELGGHIEHVTVGGERIAGIALTASQQRLQLIARSRDLTPPDIALAWLFPDLDPGPRPTLRALLKRSTALRNGLFGRRTDPQDAPSELAGVLQQDDIVISVADRPDGKLLACAGGIALQQFPGMESTVDLGLSFVDMEVSCVHVAAAQMRATIELLPLRKLERPAQRKDADSATPTPGP